MTEPSEIALIVGAGPGLSAAIARLFAREGMTVALASRTPAKLSDFAAEIGARTYACDVAQRQTVEKLFADVDRDLGAPNVVVFNPNYQVHGSIADVDAEEVLKALTVVDYGGFVVAQQAARLMLREGRGTLLFTGNPSSVEGRARSPLTAMTKMALRGLAESLARELQPSNIHVANVVVDASIDRGQADDPRRKGVDSLVEPDSIAETFLHLHRQHRTAWASLVELRPWSSAF